MLARKLDRLACHTMRIKEWQGSVVFLHEVAPGAADRSYGIHVARLAGLPEAVLARAEEVLALLEQGDQAAAAARLANDLPLFQSRPPAERLPRRNLRPTRSAPASRRSTRTTSPRALRWNSSMSFARRSKTTKVLTDSRRRAGRYRQGF